MAKWFSFNQSTQRVEEVIPSEELFKTSPLLFWSRGMDEWVLGPRALEFFLSPIEPVVRAEVSSPVVVEKKQTIGPFYKKAIAAETSIPDSIFKTDPVKNKIKAVKKQALRKKSKKNSNHIILATKKQLKKAKKKSAKLNKKKNYHKKKR